MDDDADRAADAFDVLSDPSRVAILRELADHTGGSAEDPVEFAELRRAVGFEDAGRFNYHLGKLTPDFAVKRDGGYVPTAVGLKAIGSIESGTYTDELATRSGTIDHDCPACDDPLTATYEQQVVTIECDNHETFVQTSVPPAVAEGADIDDIVAFVVGDIQRDVESLVDGACPMCSGPARRTDHWRSDAGHLMVAIDCQNCWMGTQLPVGTAALRHPAVVALYHDHGVDVRRQFFTELEFVSSMENATLVSDDPFEAELVVSVGDDELALRIYDDLTVSEAE
jgi:DNA-binding transcriptional ArsR family regulator